jgi:acetylornithine deacetylase/succinyl-diaminopimelate desuccinylase-like protein
MPIQGGAMAKAARALSLLDKHSLPYHLTAPAKLMINGISAAIGGLPGRVLAQAANPLLADGILKLLGDNAEAFFPILHNTVSPTMLTASDKLNVIPSEVSIGLDGRLLPGFKPQDLQRELRTLLGDDFKMDVVEYDPGPETSDMGLFDSLGSTIHSLDPTGTAVPLVLSGVTDARFFSKLGIQTYGFTPLLLPDDFNFIRTIHAADERVPVDALDFGLQAIFKALQTAR